MLILTATLSVNYMYIHVQLTTLFPFAANLTASSIEGNSHSLPNWSIKPDRNNISLLFSIGTNSNTTGKYLCMCNLQMY